MDSKGKPSRWRTDTALDILKRNGIPVLMTTIAVGQRQVGIRLWGAIDFLVNHQRYTVER